MQNSHTSLIQNIDSCQQLNNTKRGKKTTKEKKGKIIHEWVLVYLAFFILM